MANNQAFLAHFNFDTAESRLSEVDFCNFDEVVMNQVGVNIGEKDDPKGESFLEATVNLAEKLTGIDLDGDGDVGVQGVSIF